MYCPKSACGQPSVTHTHDTANRRAARCKAAQAAPAHPQRVFEASMRRETASGVCSGHRMTRASSAWTSAAPDPPESNKQRLLPRHPVPLLHARAQHAGMAVRQAPAAARGSRRSARAVHPRAHATRPRCEALGSCAPRLQPAVALADQSTGARAAAARGFAVGLTADVAATRPPPRTSSSRAPKPPAARGEYARCQKHA